MSIFDSGIRPAIDEYLKKKSEEVRDYGKYWSASSAGYCMRKNIMERLGLPHIERESDERKTRVFESGHIFHEWVQRITTNAGLSIEQELELLDDVLMIKGHIDDLIKIDGHLILYDYKTQHSGAFTYTKDRPMSYYHKMQLGTYMMMLRKVYPELKEARIMKISKDDLRMSEEILMWSDDLKDEIENYWLGLNMYWQEKKLPPCTCKDHENGFMAGEKYNPFYYDGEPCSIKYYREWKSGQLLQTSKV